VDGSRADMAARVGIAVVSACVCSVEAFAPLMLAPALSGRPLQGLAHAAVRPRSARFAGLRLRMQAQTETEAKTNEAAVALGSAAVDPLAIPEGVVCDGKGMCVLAEEPECIPSTPDGEDCLVPGPLTTPQQYWGPRLILLLCCVLYGTNFAFGRLLNDSLDASVVSGLRFSLATVCLSPFLKDIEKELIRPAFICSLFVAMGYIGQSVSLETISAGKSGFICSLAVITCPLLEAVFDGRRIGAPLLAAIALSIAGVGALELGDVEPPGIGDLWAMGQPIGFGAAFWKTNAMMRKFPTQTLPITAVQVLGSGTISLVWMLVEAWQHGHLDSSLLQPLYDDPKVAASIAYLGVITTAVTRIGETKALGSVSSGDASILMTTEPLWAAVFGSLLMGENLGISAWVGGGLILLACLANTVDEAQIQEWKGKLGLAS